MWAAVLRIFEEARDPSWSGNGGLLAYAVVLDLEGFGSGEVAIEDIAVEGDAVFVGEFGHAETRVGATEVAGYGHLVFSF